MQITMRDVAKAAGVSVAAVSRILSSKESAIPITDSTRQRVLNICDEMGYRPNYLARALRTNQTRLIGVIMRDVGDPFHAAVIRGIDLETREWDYRFLLSHVKATPSANDYANIVRSYGPDGMIIVGDIGSDEMPLKAMLDVCHYSILTAHPPIADVPRVIVDNRAGMHTLARHLYDLGHRDIAFAYNPVVWDMRERFESFRAFVHDQGGTLPPARILEIESTLEGGSRALRMFLGHDPRPTAIVLTNDVMAIGALHAAHEVGVRVPEDISIAGFDDIDFAGYFVPSLTTVRQPVQRIGQEAARTLLQWLMNPDKKPAEEVLLPVELIVRGSTAPPRA